MPIPASTPSGWPPTALEFAARVGLPLADDPQIEFGFLLHDIGKVAVPDAILFKPEPLDAEERTLMERHTVIGWQILRDIEFLGEAKPSCATTTSAGTVPATPMGSPARTSRSPRGSSLPPTRSTRSPPTGPTGRRGARRGARRSSTAEPGTQFDPAAVDASTRSCRRDARADRREDSDEPRAAS